MSELLMARIREARSLTLQDVEEILAGEHYYIAGGYPRDLYFGRTPKDIDCWIKWKPPGDGMGSGNIDTIEQALRDRDVDFTWYNTYGSGDDRHRLCVLQAQGADFIFMETLDGLIKGFDFNINQFYYEPGCGPVYVGDTDLNAGLVQLKFDHRVADRRARMERLWNEHVSGRFFAELTGNFYGNGGI